MKYLSDEMSAHNLSINIFIHVKFIGQNIVYIGLIHVIPTILIGHRGINNIRYIGFVNIFFIQIWIYVDLHM